SKISTLYRKMNVAVKERLTETKPRKTILIACMYGGFSKDMAKWARAYLEEKGLQKQHKISHAGYDWVLTPTNFMDRRELQKARESASKFKSADTVIVPDDPKFLDGVRRALEKVNRKNTPIVKLKDHSDLERGIDEAIELNHEKQERE
ncbi:MAG: hypothetical protein V1835_00740, partial [Candidatus Micrarchaeota archaeon]